MAEKYLVSRQVVTQHKSIKDSFYQPPTTTQPPPVAPDGVCQIALLQSQYEVHLPSGKWGCAALGRG